jgi:hypothetical protein
VDIPIVLALLLFGALILFIIGSVVWHTLLSPEARSRRALLGVSTAISQVQEGAVVKLVGELRFPTGAEPLVAPISERPCAYFRVAITEGTGKHREQVLEVEEGQDFLLEDGSGRALVRVEGAGFVVRGDHINLQASEAARRVTAYVAANAHRVRGTWDGTSPRSAAEHLLREGEKVAVVGQVTWEPDPDPGASGQSYREQARRAVVRAPRGGKVHITDDPQLC